MSDCETDDYSIWRNLPLEIIPNLLFRLPLKSLCRFKCVSHSWKSLISSAQTHVIRTNTNNPPKAILISSSNAFYSIDFAEENPTAEKIDFPLVEHSANWVKYLCSCNGLLLVSHGGNSIFLWNPLTTECKKLSESPLSGFQVIDDMYDIYSRHHGLGYDSSMDDYKVVIIASFDNTINVAVYSLKTDAWRLIQTVDFLLMGPFPGVYFNDCLHWLWRSGGLYDSYSIVAFNLSDEIFREVQQPAFFDNYEIEYHHMAVVGGCLCMLVCLSCDRIEVWMMKEYGVRESWTRSMMMDNSRNTRVNFLCLLSEDDFVLDCFRGRANRGELVVYNKKKETLRDLVIQGIPTDYTVRVTYVESLVSPNHTG